MSAREIERRLLALSERYLQTRDPEMQVEYRALHARWMAAKAQGSLLAPGGQA